MYLHYVRQRTISIASMHRMLGVLAMHLTAEGLLLLLNSVALDFLPELRLLLKTINLVIQLC